MSISFEMTKSILVRQAKKWALTDDEVAMFALDFISLANALEPDLGNDGFG